MVDILVGEVSNTKPWPRWRRVLTVLLLFPLAGCACTFARSSMVEPGPAPAGFEQLGGGIGVSIENYRQAHHFLVRDGAVAEVAELPPDNLISLSPLFDLAAHGLGGIDFSDFTVGLGTYFADSPSGRYAALEVEPRGEFMGAVSLVIVDRESRSVMAEIKSEKDWYVDRFAWSPDEKYIALLWKSYLVCGGPRVLLGHPPQLKTIELVVVDLTGRTVATLGIMRNQLMDGRIVWME